MEESQVILDKINSDIKEGKSEDEIFQFISSSLSKDPERDEKLIGLLSNIGDSKIAHVLSKILLSTKEKRLKKAIRRCLYRLKSKGVFIDEIPLEGEPVFKPLPTEPSKAFINNYDFYWDRILILQIPSPKMTIVYLFGLMNDHEGLIDFGAISRSKREFLEFFEDIKKRSGTPFIEIDSHYGAFLLSEAYQLSVRRGNPNKDFSLFKPEIEKIKKDFDRPLVYSFLSLGEFESSDLVRKGGELLQKDIFKDWYIEESLIRPYVDEMFEAEESRLILNETQKIERAMGIYEKALFDLFSGERRLIYKRRLEETAYFLMKIGMEEEAKISLAIAMEIEKPLNRLQPNQFLLQLIIKSIRGFLEETYEEQAKNVSLIVKP